MAGDFNLLSPRAGKLKIGTISIDVSVSENHVRRNRVTTNPVEKGADMADHVQREPKEVTVEGLVSATPIAYLGYGGDGKPMDVYGALVKAQEGKTLLTIETGLDSYSSMVISELTLPRDSSTGQALRFRAVCKEIVMAESAMVDVAKPAADVSSLASSKSSLGKVESKTPAPATQTKGASWLSQLTGVGG